MAIVIPSSFAPLSIQAGPLVRATDLQPLVENAHLCRATRMRSVWGYCYPVTTAVVSPSWIVVVTAAPIVLSAATSGSLSIAVQGAEIEARVTVTDGVSTASVVLTQSSASVATVYDTLADAMMTDGAELALKLEIRTTGVGSGSLIGVLVAETDRSSL